MHAARFCALAAATAFVVTGCVIPSPSPGTNASLNAVAATSATNAWAVGVFHDRNGAHELMERWNGQSWQEVFLPPPIGKSLTSITAVNGHNVWAVSELRTLHFGGLGWSSFANPAAIAMQKVASAPDGSVYGLGTNSTFAGSLWLMTAGGWRHVSDIPKSTSQPGCNFAGSASDLAVVNAHELWIVGNGKQANSTQSCTVALRWNATAWQSFPTPAVAGGATLAAVSARAGNDVWAVGETLTFDPQVGVTFEGSLVLHWNGTTWASVPGLNNGFLRDVDATGDGVWAVGTQLVGSGFPLGMLILKWDGKVLVRQTAQHLTVAGTVEDDSNLSGVSVRGGVATSVGDYVPRAKVLATLTERRNAS
jgi:hypothetical protein